jgi:hypothetical protein
MNVWTIVAWVGGICLCLVIVLVTINILVVVLRNVRRPAPPMPPYQPPQGWPGWPGDTDAPAKSIRDVKRDWDGNGPRG